MSLKLLRLVIIFLVLQLQCLIGGWTHTTFLKSVEEVVGKQAVEVEVVPLSRKTERQLVKADIHTLIRLNEGEAGVKV